MLAKTLLVAALSALVMTQVACAHVAPYERAKIAHPTMTPGDLAGTGESHVHAVLEGASGGSLGAQSGCGCN